MAGLHAAAGLKTVASLRSTNVGGGGGGAGRSSFSAGGAAVAPQQQVTQTFRVEGLQPGDLISEGQLVSILDEAAKRGLVPEFAR